MCLLSLNERVDVIVIFRLIGRRARESRGYASARELTAACVFVLARTIGRDSSIGMFRVFLEARAFGRVIMMTCPCLVLW